jgi:hypothetical protein
VGPPDKRSGLPATERPPLTVPPTSTTQSLPHSADEHCPACRCPCRCHKPPPLPEQSLLPRPGEAFYMAAIAAGELELGEVAA